MSNQRYRFRNFLLLPATRELYQGERLVEVPARALDALVYLVQHRNRAIGRDELISAVWSRIDVADTLLAQTILRLRRLLGDHGSQGAIRTIARFGYHWVEPTQIEDLDRADPPMPDPGDAAGAIIHDPEAGTRHHSRFRPPAALLTVIGATSVLVAVVLLRQPDRVDRAPRPATAVLVPADANTEYTGAAALPAAVLPARIPDLADWSWLRLGLMDMVANRLRLGGLPTAPSESVLAMLPEQATVDPGAGRLAGASRTIHAEAELRADASWRVRLVVVAADEGEPLQVEAVAADPLAAAHAAADRLLVQLGKAQPTASGPGHGAVEDLAQRVRAAVLADQLELAQELIEAAPEAVRQHPEIELQSARIDQGRGRYAQAEQRLLALQQQLPVDVDPVLRGRVLNAIGATLFRRRNIVQARVVYDQAIAVLQGHGDAIAMAEAYMGRAAVASADDTGLDAAAADLGRARTEMEAGGNALGVAQIDMNLGLIQIKRYRPATALPLLRQAEQQFERLGASEALVYARYVTASAQLQLLDHAGALESVARFWPPTDHTANERLRWRLALSRSVALAAVGRLTEAQAQLEQIRTGAKDLDDASVLAGAGAMAVLLDIAWGQHDQAVRQMPVILTPALAEQRPDLFVTTWTAYLRSLRQLEQLSLAADQTRDFAAWVQMRPNPWRELQLALAQAEQRWAEHADDEALAGFARAFELAQALAIPEDLVHVAEPYTMALIERGQIDRASAVVGRIAAWSDRDLRAAWAQAQLYRAQERDEAWRRALVRVDQLKGERVLPEMPVE